jgi:RNA polymerase sigma-54 factor
MATVADEVGVHETTVSRAIAGKVHRHPARRVRHEVLLLPRREDRVRRRFEQHQCQKRHRRPHQGRGKHKPLSDDKLAKLLDKQGIKVARRTVAKYREALGILPSHLRKSFS